MEPREESVTQHLAHEDAALLRRLEDVEALVCCGGFHSAALGFGELRRALEAHLWAEERTLVPGAGAAHVTSEPLRALLQEHEQLRVLTNQVSEAISRWDQPAFRRLARRLVSLLRDHHRRERALARAAASRVATLGAFLSQVAEAEVERRRACCGEASCGCEPRRNS
jgi:type IV secretory pathway VirJ component